MPLIECPDCKKMISDKAQQCINCGCPVVAPAVEKPLGFRVDSLYTLSPTVPPTTSTPSIEKPVSQIEPVAEEPDEAPPVPVTGSIAETLAFMQACTAKDTDSLQGNQHDSSTRSDQPRRSMLPRLLSIAAVLAVGMIALVVINDGFFTWSKSAPSRPPLPSSGSTSGENPSSTVQQASSPTMKTPKSFEAFGEPFDRGNGYIFYMAMDPAKFEQVVVMLKDGLSRPQYGAGRSYQVVDLGVRDVLITRTNQVTGVQTNERKFLPHYRVDE